MSTYGNIRTHRRMYDWHACLVTDSATWECGKTEEEAIGRLVRRLATGADDTAIKCIHCPHISRSVAEANAHDHEGGIR